MTAKRLFVTEAAEEILRSKKKVNTSRISAMTGVYRMEVDRVLQTKEEPLPTQAAGVIPRVVGIWEGSDKFRTANGKPRVLTYSGEQNEFRELVSTVSQHLNAGTVLFELERSGMVEKTQRGVKLIRRLSRLGEDRLRAFDLLSRDMETLIRASEENVLIDKPISNLHIRTEYDNVYRSAIPEIRRWLVDEGKAFHRRAREFISQFDMDIGSTTGRKNDEAGTRVTLTAVSFTDYFPDDLEELPPRRQDD